MLIQMLAAWLACASPQLAAAAGCRPHAALQLSAAVSRATAAVAAAHTDASSAAATIVGPSFSSADPGASGAGAQAADKPKKKKKSDAVAPDEPVDPEITDTAGSRGFHFVWKQHPSLRYGSVFRLDLQAKFQEDAHGSYDGAQGLNCPNDALPTTCTWELHRDRIGIEGFVTKKIQYEAERELSEQELSEKDLLIGYKPKSVWKDVDVNVSYVKNAQVQAGRFKIPFSLDALTGDSHNDYAFRSLGASYLAPSRDTGVMVHGKFFKKSLNYWTGVFAHDGDNSRSKKIVGGDTTVAGRITASPLRKVSPIFAAFDVGTALTYSRLSDDPSTPNGLRGRTILTQDTFADAVYVNGHRRRWEADLDWTLGPASLRSEYTWVSDDRQAQGISGQDLSNARSQAYYISGTWILTGEPKTRPVKAAYEFLRGGLGAIELAARYERMWFDSVGGSGLASATPRADLIAPDGDKALTLGVNWTFNRWLKVQANAIREQVEDPTRNPITGGGAFWSRVIRFQFVL